MQQNKANALYHKQPLQEDLAHSIFAPDAPYASSLDSKIIENGISVAGRLEVYKNNVIGGLIDVMLERYPTISPLVGVEFARQMARDYILSTPPKAANLNEYGGDYAAFIRGFAPAAELAFLPDIAELEDLEHRAYYAPDALELTVENAAEYLPKIMNGSYALGVHPSVGVMKSDYPILGLRQYTQSEQSEDQEFDLGSGGQSIMIWRLGWRVETMEITLSEFALLTQLQSGQSINDALEHVLNLDEEFNFEVFLQAMLERDVFTVEKINK